MNNILKVVKDIHIFGSHEVWSCHDVSWCFFVVFFLLLESTRFNRGMTVRILERWKRVHNALPKTIIYYRFLAWKKNTIFGIQFIWLLDLTIDRSFFILTNFLHHGHGCLIAFRCIYFSHQHKNIALRTILSMFCSSCFERQMYHYDKSCRVFCYVSKKPWYLQIIRVQFEFTIGHGFLDDRCYQHFLKLEDFRGSLNITRNIRNHPRRDDILYLWSFLQKLPRWWCFRWTICECPDAWVEFVGAWLQTNECHLQSAIGDHCGTVLWQFLASFASTVRSLPFSFQIYIYKWKKLQPLMPFFCPRKRHQTRLWMEQGAEKGGGKADSSDFS